MDTNKILIGLGVVALIAIAVYFYNQWQKQTELEKQKDTASVAPSAGSTAGSFAQQMV